jgi:hypothetical protein
VARRRSAQVRAVFSAILVGGIAFAPGASAATRAALKKGHATRILTAPWLDSALPSGLSNARLTRSTRKVCVSAGKFKVCKGFPEVDVELNGPDSEDAIAYVVDSTPSDAKDLVTFLGIPVKRVGSVPGRAGSILGEGAFSSPNSAGQYVTSEEAIAVAVSTDVAVEAVAGGANLQTDAASAEAMLSAAIAHLPK